MNVLWTVSAVLLLKATGTCAASRNPSAVPANPGGRSLTTRPERVRPSLSRHRRRVFSPFHELSRDARTRYATAAVTDVKTGRGGVRGLQKEKKDFERHRWRAVAKRLRPIRRACCVANNKTRRVRRAGLCNVFTHRTLTGPNETVVSE